MNRVLPAIVTFIYMMFFTNACFAEILNPTRYLIVDFINDTNYECKINAYLKHGKWKKKPPESIQKQSSTYWVGEQTAYGPNIIVTFTCGGYSFSTKNQQNYSGLRGGDQHYTTFGVDKHLHVINKQTQHAAYWKKGGKAEIIVSSKGGLFGFE
ncbi:hypothetical protein [Candidatus Sororendozoicomonas aggregata]|uniref:hypothetical protein n=1 Tax=Candidatus Sororendozoicomonas aggregata TaxID=3073239 RepID=UPI002ED55027